MAKIAVELERALSMRAAGGGPGGTSARFLAEGEGWSVTDVICTSGPQDRPFEESHSEVRIALVAAGTFQYRAQLPGAAGTVLMTPGSFLLGGAGQCFECTHEHGAGDRCVSFGYAPEYFERIAADAGISPPKHGFGILRLPPLRTLARVVAQACAGVASSDATTSSWEELSLHLAIATLRQLNGVAARVSDPPPGSLARVTRSIRAIERGLDSETTLGTLSKEAGLSRYHFLRTFELLTGLTPHQYLLRARLREAAMRLTVERTKVIDIALDCGFGDVSNFNRAFRTEFGVNPRAYRAQPL
ncbi:MAG: helix-turn-helix domain-containing protein [Blastocatellia bacterium]